jgi:hypothetical protein
MEAGLAVACWIPARKAASVDRMTALRAECGCENFPKLFTLSRVISLFPLRRPSSLPAMKLLRLPLIAALLLASTAFAAFSDSEKFSKNCPLSANGTFRLSNINGAVDVSVWDKNEILIEAVKRANSPEDLGRIHIEVEAQGNHVTVKSVHDKTGWFHSNVRGEVRYSIKVPAGATLEKIGCVNSTVTVSGVHGAVTLATVNGGIRATDLGGDARLETVNGSIHAQFAVVASGQQISAESVNGSCELSLPTDASAHVSLSTVNGSTACDFPITIERSGRHSLRGTIGTGSASVKAETVNGAVRIAKR